MVTGARSFPPLVRPTAPRLIPVMTIAESSSSSRVAHFTTERTARCVVRGPEDPSAVRELWIVLHGYGQLARAIVTSIASIDDGTRLIVAPEALSRFYNSGGSRDSHQEATVGASWMTREDRLSEIADQMTWLQKARDAFAAPLAPGVPLTVLGFSQGAAAASRWVASGRVNAARCICWGGAIAPEVDLGESSPLRAARTYLVVGNRDRFISEEQVATERARLDAAGLPYTFVDFDGGHRLDDATLRRFTEGSL